MSYNPGKKSWDTALLPTYGLSVHLHLPTPNTMLMLMHPKQTHYSNIILRGVGFGELNKDFPLQNNTSPVVILSSVPGTFGQDCSSCWTKYLKLYKISCYPCSKRKIQTEFLCEACGPLIQRRKTRIHSLQHRLKRRGYQDISKISLLVLGRFGISLK